MISTFIASPLGNLPDQIASSFASLGLMSDFNNPKSIFIKPDLTYPRYKEGVTTREEFVDQLVAALRKINSSTKIYIGEGEGCYNSFSMTDVMRTMGYFELEEKYPNVKIVKISKVPSHTFELWAKEKPYPIDQPKLFDEIDFSITCPLQKVHCLTGITLSFKNQWGCLPDTIRLKNHYVFDEIIEQVCDKLKFKYAFLDGKYGLDDDGPMMGQPIEVNCFATSNSLGVFDVLVSEMMGVNWKSIGHLRLADKYSFMPSRDQIQVIEDHEALSRKFKLNRTSWNYPALIAYRSKPLTHLFYLSNAS
jgi:uncharacterized protein (DUF362 family)